MYLKVNELQAQYISVCPGLNANSKYFLRFFKKLKYAVKNDVYEKEELYKQ
jgi:hypothetical protein